MTFDEWWRNAIARHLHRPESIAEAAWQAATLAEREECAKVCDVFPSRYLSSYEEGVQDAKLNCAEAIRARSGEGK